MLRSAVTILWNASFNILTASLRYRHARLSASYALLLGLEVKGRQEHRYLMSVSGFVGSVSQDRAVIRNVCFLRNSGFRWTGLERRDRVGNDGNCDN